MPSDRATALFYELFSGLPRQGPGTAASTRRALGLVPDVGPRTRVLDIGCGTGAQTLVLADSSPSRIVAVDIHPPFVDALNRKAHELGIEDRLEARVADMRRLDFADGAFDLIWCEGAITSSACSAAAESATACRSAKRPSDIQPLLRQRLSFGHVETAVVDRPAAGGRALILDEEHQPAGLGREVFLVVRIGVEHHGAGPDCTRADCASLTVHTEAGRSPRFAAAP